jgi:hypothetical protein
MPFTVSVKPVPGSEYRGACDYRATATFDDGTVLAARSRLPEKAIANLAGQLLSHLGLPGATLADSHGCYYCANPGHQPSERNSHEQQDHA